MRGFVLLSAKLELGPASCLDFALGGRQYGPNTSCQVSLLNFILRLLCIATLMVLCPVPGAVQDDMGRDMS